MLLSLVLGPLLEQEFRRALTVSGGDLSIFVTRPISATLLAVALASLAGSYCISRRSKDGRTRRRLAAADS